MQEFFEAHPSQQHFNGQTAQAGAAAAATAQTPPPPAASYLALDVSPIMLVCLPELPISLRGPHPARFKAQHTEQHTTLLNLLTKSHGWGKPSAHGMSQPAQLHLSGSHTTGWWGVEPHVACTCSEGVATP
jgi:hypothetical protein